ncbi:hypothetical protein [Caulobacter sp.]|uniref:hypothetical protein n=1 Tax=Caulobacter sp. TaxID=78 RepID=UPI0016070886
MRQMMKVAGLLTILAVSSGWAAQTSSNLPSFPGKPDLLAPNGLRGLGVDLAEIRLRIVGGYDGVRIRRGDMTLVRTLAGVRFYKIGGGLYVDRDGDHVIDACAAYVPRTGVVTADWNCDGRGDQLLFDLIPPPPIRSPQDLARRLEGLDGY